MAKRKKKKKGILNTASKRIRQSIEDYKESRRKKRQKQAADELAAAIKKSQENPSNYDLVMGRLKWREALRKQKEAEEAEDNESKTG